MRLNRVKNVYKLEENQDGTSPLMRHMQLDEQMNSYKFVSWVVDEMPCNSVVQEDENKSQQGRTCCHDWDPCFSVQVAQVDHPRASSSRIRLIGAVFRPARVAGIGTTSERRRHSVRHVESLELDIPEDQIAHQRPDNNRGHNREVGDNVSELLVCQKRRELSSSQKESYLNCANANEQGQ